MSSISPLTSISTRCCSRHVGDQISVCQATVEVDLKTVVVLLVTSLCLRIVDVIVINIDGMIPVNIVDDAS